ncbi:MAG: hypothetical protein JW889_10145 [Verrucomicrobia bacterium]|nr:hypothetical protein [Verrucomicrobiota bacterium]
MRQVWVSIACGCAALVLLCGCENKLSALKRAARLAKLERHAEAVRAYERYIALVGDGPDSTYERAEAWYQIGLIRTHKLRERDSGVEAFERATVLRPEYSDVQFQLAFQYVELSAEASPEAAAEFRAKAAAALRAGLAQRPETTAYELAPGTFYSPRLRLSDVEHARGHLNEAIRQLYIFEHYSDDDAWDWYEIGSFFRRHNEHAKALYYFKRAFDALDDTTRGQPKGMDVRNALIGACIRNGYLERALELHDESRNVLAQYEGQFRSLPQKARLEEAELRAALVRWRSELLQLLSQINESSGRYKEALGVLLEYHAMVPQDRALLLREAELAARVGDFRIARELLDRFRHLAPQDPTAILTEASILYEEKDYRGYIARIEAYLVRVPDKIQPRGFRALALVKAGDVDRGISQLRAYNRAEPNFPPLQLTLAQAYSVAGQTDQAIWWLRRVMDTHIVAPHNLTSEPNLENVRQDSSFPELLRESRYRMNLLQDVHEAEDRLYRGYESAGLNALQRLREQNTDIPFTTYALARAHVFTGDFDAAFPLLIECAEAGYFSPSRLRSDIYLTELRTDDRRFSQLLSAIRQPWPDTTAE